LRGERPPQKRDGVRGERPVRKRDAASSQQRPMRTRDGARTNERALRPRDRMSGSERPARSRDGLGARSRDGLAARSRDELGAGTGSASRNVPRALSAMRTSVPVRELSSEPHPGHFLLTTRQGAEQDLVDELLLLGVTDPAPRVIAPSLVLAPKVPKREKRPVDLTFARQGFPVLQSVREHDPEAMANRIARSLRGQLERAKSYALHVWVPDSDLGNPLSSMAEELAARLAARLDKALPEATRVDDATLRRIGSIPLAQVCLIDPERAVAGLSYSNAALSLAPGGRTRVRLTGEFPSRAARKLEEALAWLGVEPGPGELCVDLGAAPGGWTYVLAERRARVIAVDPAKLRPEVLAKRGVRHLQESAFTYTPAEPVDWLFCDMAWRPLEAAALLAKWGRRGWTRMLVANIKLPMRRKAELLARVRTILESEGNYRNVRMKQLYHDREEITLTAHIG
jgi:23S rRNA (cytidine2498-2'-O)-methyltransferase